MANLSEDIQCAGSDTRPPMLDRTDFASWQQRIRLYCRGKENGVNILKSIDEGPFQMGTFRETLAEGTEGAPHLGPERLQVYSDLSPEDKERYNADIRATNILLQGLPKDIYSLINHYTDAKDIWDNVKMLLEGSELTKEDRESQLYDDFEHFRQNKGETIHDYYVWFAKLINDMRNIKMTMSRMQLNSKFVNNMLPEWGRFVTAVKLNRGLRDSNYDQLYAYLKQHEAHANENKMILDRFTQHIVDPLALMSNVSHPRYYSQSSTTLPSTYVPPHFADNTQLDSGLSLTDNLIENLTNTLALLTQSYKTYPPKINNQLKTSSNPRNQATVQDDRVIVQNVLGQQNRGQGNNAQGAGTTGYRGALTELGMVIQVKQGRLSATTATDLALNVDNVFQAYDCDAFDSDVDEAPMAQTMFMANLSSADPIYVSVHLMILTFYQSNMISYEQYVKDNAMLVVQITTQNTEIDNSLTAELATYKEQVELYERRARFELMKREQKIDEQLRIVITDHNIKEETLKKELHYVKCNLLLTSTITSQWRRKNKKKLELDQHCLAFNISAELRPELPDRNSTIKDSPEGKIGMYTRFIEFANYRVEAEVDQNVVDRKHDEIERKNLLIAHDNLIADCLSKEVFYVATNSELNVSRFTEMHDAHTIVEARCLELEAELSNLRDKIQNDNHNELVKRFSNLEVNHLNLQLKYQNLKESFGNNPSTPARDTPDFDSAFVIGKMKASLQGKDNVINKLKTQISHLQETRSEADRTLDFRALDFQITQLTEKVTVLQEQNELFRAENAKIKQHYKELYDSIKITRAKHLE
ncbi:hypothetical protein Tco_0796950 [Tanacetum coccineum]